MRVALVLDQFDPFRGGLAQWAAEFAGYLQQAHEVQVVTFEEGEHCLPVAVRVLPPVRGEMERARQIDAYFASLAPGVAPDVVHDTGTSWAGDVFHPQTGSRLHSLNQEVASFRPLRRVRGTVSPKMVLRRRGMARLEHMQATRARRIIAVSGRIRDMLAACHGVAPERIRVVPNGVDTIRFAPARTAGLRAGARATLGVGDVVLFLAAAYNLHLKGIGTAIRATARLVAEGAPVTLAIAGAAADAYWNRLVAEAGAAEHVRFLGPVADMERLFAAADAFVHPTRWDACSRATLEAMAAGLPTITTAVNGASEIMADGRDGFVLPGAGTVDLLAARMRALLDPQLRQRLGNAGLETARRHDRRDNFRAVESILAEAAELRRAR